MHGADAGAVVSVEVLEEEQVVAPGWIVLRGRYATKDRPAIVVASPEGDDPRAQVGADVSERLARSSSRRVGEGGGLSAQFVADTGDGVDQE